MRQGIWGLSLAAAVLILASTVFGTDRLVPSEYATIKAAINACNNWDTVIVADDTYTGADNKNLDFGGKAITVRSENGAASCIIDCENSGRGFIFQNGEDANSVVDGFTITQGKVTGNPAKGGGIYCDGASPTIQDCIITNNKANGLMVLKKLIPMAKTLMAVEYIAHRAAIRQLPTVL